MFFCFLALIYVSSFETIKRNKILDIPLKNSLNVISLFIIKVKVIYFIIFVLWAIAVIKFVYDWNSPGDQNSPVSRFSFFLGYLKHIYLLPWCCDCSLKGLNKSNIVGRLLFTWSKTSMQLFKVIIRLSIFVSVCRSALDAFLPWNLLFLGLCFKLFEPLLVYHFCLSPNLTCIT